MADVVYLLITVAFFALTIGFVRVCDRIIGPDPAPGERDVEMLRADANEDRSLGTAAR